MASSYNGVALPKEGTAITFTGGKLQIPDNPIIPFIEGDGTGRDIWKASRRVFDAAVQKAYKGKRRVAWYEVFAGEKAFGKFKTWLPDDTVEAIRQLRVAIKGPLTTPVGGGIRSPRLAALDLLARERLGDEVEPRAAVLLRDDDPEDPQLGHPLDQLEVEPVVDVVLHRDRQHPLVDEGPDGLLDEALLVGKLEVHT